MRYWKKDILIKTALVSLLASGCASDEIQTDSPKGSKTIGLGVSVEQMIDAPGTRSAESPLMTVEAKGCANPVYLQIADIGMIRAHECEATNATRGQAVTSSTFYDSFQLYYYEYDKTSSWSGQKATMAPTGTATMEATEGWLTNKFWPGPKKR